MQTTFPEIYIQYLTSILVVLLLVAFAITILLLNQKRKLVQQKQIESIKASFEKELIQTKLEIQEDVLKNISMEIHDNIGQILLLANVNISLIQSLPLPAEAPILIMDTKTLISKATEDLSQLSRSLYSDRITEMGVFAAIKYELLLLSEKKLFTAIINDSFKQDGKLLRKDVQLLVFRMFQEICNNIIKHARASAVELSVYSTLNEIVLMVSDNGIGFDFLPELDGTSKYNGVGMRSLQSRVMLFNGEIQIKSILNQGTSITIFIPITAISV